MLLNFHSLFVLLRLFCLKFNINLFPCILPYNLEFYYIFIFFQSVLSVTGSSETSLLHHPLLLVPLLYFPGKQPLINQGQGHSLGSRIYGTKVPLWPSSSLRPGLRSRTGDYWYSMKTQSSICLCGPYSLPLLILPPTDQDRQGTAGLHFCSGDA